MTSSTMAQEFSSQVIGPPWKPVVARSRSGGFALLAVPDREPQLRGHVVVRVRLEPEPRERRVGRRGRAGRGEVTAQRGLRVGVEVLPEHRVEDDERRARMRLARAARAANRSRRRGRCPPASRRASAIASRARANRSCGSGHTYDSSVSAPSSLVASIGSRSQPRRSTISTPARERRHSAAPEIDEPHGRVGATPTRRRPARTSTSRAASSTPRSTPSRAGAAAGRARGDHEQARHERDGSADLVGLRRTRHRVEHTRRRIGAAAHASPPSRRARRRRHRPTGSARRRRARHRSAPSGERRRAAAARTRPGTTPSAYGARIRATGPSRSTSSASSSPSAP